MEKIEYKKFSLKEILATHGIAIHCPTEKSFTKLINLLKRKNFITEAFTQPIEEWWAYDKETTIYLNGVWGYGDVEHSIREGHKIVSVYDLLFSESRAYVLRYLV